MAKTKKNPTYLGNQKLSMIIVGLVAILVGVILGTAIDSWQESAFDIGQSEGIEDAAIRGTQSQNIKQIQNKNTNQATTRQ